MKLAPIASTHDEPSRNRPTPRGQVQAHPRWFEHHDDRGDAHATRPVPRASATAPRNHHATEPNPFLNAPARNTFRPQALGPLPPVQPPPRSASQGNTVTNQERQRFPQPTCPPAPALEPEWTPRSHLPSGGHATRFRDDRDLTSSHAYCTAPVRAIAVAHEKSNAVGTVELCCTDGGLLVRFVRVSAYTEGYVPYPSTSSERVVVPYDQVARVEVDADGLVHLALDPSTTPFHRLVLAGIAKDLKHDHASSYRRRARIERNVSVAALALWMPLALVLRAVFPDLSIVMPMGVAVSASLILHLTRRDIAAKLVLFNRSAEQTRDELLADLRYRLAPGRLRTAAALIEVPAPQAAPWGMEDRREPESGSLKGLFATAGVMAAVTTVAILIGKNVLFSSPTDPQAMWSDRTEREPQANATSTTNAASAITPDSTPVIPPPPPCVCDRADSPLWDEGVPRMSVLAHNRPGTTSYDRPSVYPEIAVVNNTSEDLVDIVMVVDFMLGPRDGNKARVVDKQDLFWEGHLAPGKAVKWRVRGRGDDFVVRSFIEGMLGQDAKSAPADAFYKLSMTANTPSVRVHGTKMLAYLGDERVAEGLDKLRQEGREEWSDTVEQIAAAAHALRVCSVQSAVDPGDSTSLVVKACVYNAGAVRASRPWMTATATLESSTSVGRWSLAEDLPSKTGLITTGTVRVPRTEEDADPRKATVHVEAGR